MIILGIDPGYAIIGYGTVEFKNCKYSSRGYGAITTSSKDDFLYRLESIFDKVCEIISVYKPDAVAIEKLYFQNNQKTAIEVAEARGVILLAVKKHNIPIYEYTPLQIKNAVTGYGKALKKQVMLTVQRLLNLDEIPKPDDTADALAVGICHANSLGYHYVNKRILESKLSKKL